VTRPFPVDRRAGIGDLCGMPTKFIGKLLAAVLFSGTMLACYVRAETGGEEHCRDVVRNRGEIETCKTKCNVEICRTHCEEQERVSRERHCWVD
jgi:hypothetical protein